MVPVVAKSATGSPKNSIRTGSMTEHSDQSLLREQSQLSSRTRHSYPKRMPSPDWPSISTPNLNKRTKGGWAAVIRDSSTLLTNVDWDQTFWTSTNASNTMHTLGVQEKDDAKDVAAFWVTNSIDYASVMSWSRDLPITLSRHVTTHMICSHDPDT